MRLLGLLLSIAAGIIIEYDLFIGILTWLFGFLSFYLGCLNKSKGEL